MNGAECLLSSLVTSGVEVCFANPGTSEMHFVAALDLVPEMRPILALHENVATGAADGYGRMTGKPACTLLHLGPGLANGLANLHNAKRAGSPIVNIVGDHAASHLKYDAPLTSDIKGIARSVSSWVHSSPSARQVGGDAVLAVRAALEPPGQIATLILPANTAWDEADGIAPVCSASNAVAVSNATVDRIASLLMSGRRTAILMRGSALLESGLKAAGAIAAKTGARLICDTFAPRLQRGANRVRVERLPYFSEDAIEFLAGTELVVLVGTTPPVSFFAYPDKASWLAPAGSLIEILSKPHEDGVRALQALENACGANSTKPTFAELRLPDYSLDGILTTEFVMNVVARHLPESAIVADESASGGFPYFDLTATSRAHDFLNITGGAIGSMMAVAIGAAVASPNRKVVSLQGDGGAMYILPALWTQARENLDIVTVIYSNRAYGILSNELSRVGAIQLANSSSSLLSLENPSLDWVKLASGLGVSAVRTDTRRRFDVAFLDAMNMPGPHLIEVQLG